MFELETFMVFDTVTNEFNPGWITPDKTELDAQNRATYLNNCYAVRDEEGYVIESESNMDRFIPVKVTIKKL